MISNNGKENSSSLNYIIVPPLLSGLRRIDWEEVDRQQLAFLERRGRNLKRSWIGLEQIET